jgi:replicative DNA helicase
MEITKLESRESEAALLGSVLINPDVYEDCVWLQASDFYDARNADTWRKIQKCKADGRDVDITILSDMGVDSAYLTGLIGSCSNSFYAKSYAEVIKDKSTRRRQVQIATLIAQGAHNGGVNVSKIVGQLVETSEIKRKAEHVSSGLGSFFDEINERFNNPKTVWGIETGYMELDEFTGGLHKQQVMMFSGAPGTGKSLLAQCIVLQSAMKGTRWAVYSMEMAKEDLICRWVGMLTGMSEESLLSGKFPPEKWKLITYAIEVIESLPIYINDIPSIETSVMSVDLARLQAENGIDAVLVDYLELLSDKGDNSNEATAAKSRNFREICREKDLAGVIVQSVTKDGMAAATGGIVSKQQGDSGKKSFATSQAALIGVRGPADVTHDADIIFMLVVDPEDESGKTIAALPAKKRRGTGKKKPIRFKFHPTAPKLEGVSEKVITFNH